MRLYDKVKVIQKNAPYNLHGEIGTIVEIEKDHYNIWYKFLSDKDLELRESFFLSEHLEFIKSGTKRHFKDSFELKQFLVNISEDFNNEDIEDKDFTKLIDNELRQINQDIVNNGISFFKGYEITCDYDE